MELQGKHSILLGLGRSSVAAARLLLAQGAQPFVSDAGDAKGREHYAQELDDLGVDYELGMHSEDRILSADLLVLSPGVPLSAPIVKAFQDTGKPVLGELELASCFAKAPLYAITGTNGKTTATELLAAMLRACGKTVALAGNNDTALSEAVLIPEQPDAYVLEVSSYQLESIETLHPKVACILNLTPDHLGRHGTMEEYGATKARLMMNQRGEDHALLNADDPAVANLPVPSEVTTTRFSATQQLTAGIWSDGTTLYDGDKALVNIQDNPLPGKHNLENVVATLAMLHCGGHDLEKAVQGLKTFTGVPHRIEKVPTNDSLNWYNDSKSTNIDSLRVALESFDKPIILIAGGEGKGASYNNLVPLVSQHVKHCICIGQDAPILEQAFAAATTCTRADSMAVAVQAARAQAQADDTILLSPGCASFDWYNNFEERGDHFKALIHETASKPNEVPTS